MPTLFKYYDILIFGNYLHQYFVMNLGVDHPKITSGKISTINMIKSMEFFYIK